MYQEIYRQYNAPTEKDFTLRIISKHPETMDKELVQHSLQTEVHPTIGVKDLEAFEVHFSNNSIEDCQVRISLDGVDVFNAKPASLEVNSDMWIVRAGKTLHLRAWHETSAGGSQLVFTTGDKSVAYNTGGDMAHKGVIAVAVYTERNRPIRYYSTYGQIYTNENVRRKGMQVNSDSVMRGSIGGVYSAQSLSSSAPSPAVAGGAQFDTIAESLDKTAMVGAGDYIDQKTFTTTGLKEPVLNHIKQVKYLFWEKLEEKMMKQNQAKVISVLGFPEAEKVKQFSNLDNIPKVSATKANPFYKMIERVKNIVW